MRIREYIRILRRGRAWLPVFVLVLGAAVGFGIAVRAQTAGGTEGITFPVAELGNCGSQSECRAYCDQPANAEACLAFAKAHGLVNEEEASRARKFVQVLNAGGGPGGCRTPQECEAFCTDITNIEVCIQFAEENGLEDKNLEEGRKILAYLKSGGRTPGGCTSKDSCEKYCSDFENAQECFDFARGAGLTEEVTGPEGQELRPEQVQRLMQLTQEGKTPGGCRNREECDTYCGEASHLEECINFAVQAGFMNSEEAEKIKKTGGKGPGGCDSKASCEAFCNNPVNRETCFNFAKEHNLISEEDLREMQEGMVRLRQGLESAPPEVSACLKSALGPNIVQDIQSGSLTPGPEIGDRTRDCFERFGRQMSPQAGMGEMPEAVRECVRAKLGDDFGKIEAGQMQMTPEMGDVFRVCAQQMQLMAPGPQAGSGREGPIGGPPPEMIQNFLRSAPPEVSACLQSKLGNVFEGVRSGQVQPSQEVGERMRECFESFRPPEGVPRGGPQGQEQMMGPQPMMGGEGGSGGLPLYGPMPQNEPRGEFPGMQPGLPPMGMPPQGMEGQMFNQQFMQPGVEQPMMPPPTEPPPSSRAVSPSPMGLLLNVFAPLVGGR